MKKFFTLFFSILLVCLFPLFAFPKDCNKAKEYSAIASKLPNDSLSLIKKETLYKKAIKLCPSYAPAHNNLGDVYEKQGRYEEAIAQYKKAVKLRPDAPYPYFGIGDIYFKTGRYNDAINWYKKGMNLRDKYKPQNEVEAKDLEKEYAFTEEQLKIANDLSKGGVIKAQTMRGIFSHTRGVGEVISINFGESLIPFDFDKYNIREDAKPQLDEIGKFLRDLFSGEKSISPEPNNFPVFEIAGHTDIRGTDEYNLELSRKRAKSVINYLVEEFEIPRNKLNAVGYGERVPICTEGASEEMETPCNALNRRVEIVRKEAEVVTVEGRTRTAVRGKGGVVEPEIILDTGFFYQRYGETLVNPLKEGISLRSRSDKYFIFFRPSQNCYVYILQEDSKGNLNLLFPSTSGNAYVEKDKDYWVPSFGKAYTLDEIKGMEKIYLLATSSPLESLTEGVRMEEVVKIATRGLQTKSIKTRIIVIKPKKTPEYIPSQEVDRISNLIERVEGEGGWVRVIKFNHE